MNDNSMPSIPTVEDHATPPAFTPPPPPPAINPASPPPSKKPSKPKIIAAAIVGVVLVIGLAAGVFLNSRPQPTRVDTQAILCTPGTTPTASCDSCGGDNQGYCGFGDSDTCYCNQPNNDRCDPGMFDNNNGGCSSTPPGPTNSPGNQISCQDTTTPGSPNLSIRIDTDSINGRSYQLQKCFCPGGELPCNACDYSQPGVTAPGTTETHSMPAGNCGSIQLDVSPISGEFGACFAWYTTNVACPGPTLPPTRPVCTNLTLSTSALTPGGSVTATSTSQANASSFTFALYNIDHPSGDGSPSPICVTTGGDVTTIIGTCPAGTHHLIYSDPSTSLRTTGTRNLTYADIFVADQNNGGAVAQRVQINAYISEGGQTSAGIAVCAKGISVASVPTVTPSNTPTNSPTPTTVPVTTCQQLEMYRGGVRITPDQIRRGDTITLRGFASAVNTTVSQIRFRITLGGTAQTPVLVPATLQGGVYRAEHQITINSATTYSITIEPVSP